MAEWSQQAERGGAAVVGDNEAQTWWMRKATTWAEGVCDDGDSMSCSLGSKPSHMGRASQAGLRPRIFGQHGLGMADK